MNRRVLLICYYFPPLGLGGIGRPLNLFRKLPDYGYDCDVLTVKPVLYRAYEPELLDGLDASRIFRSGSRDPQRLLHLLGMRKVSSETINIGRPVAGKFFPDSKVGWVKPAVRLGRRLHRQRPYDLIISTSPPISSHLIGLELSRQCGLPLVADFRDFWTIYKLEEVFREQRLVKRGQELLARLKSEAAAITGVNSSIVDYLGRGETITNGYNSELAELWRQPPATDKFSIGLLGHQHDTREIEPLLRLLKIMREKYPEAYAQLRLVQVGQVDPGWFRQLLNEHQLRLPLELHGRQSRRDTIRLLAAAHMFYLGISEREGTGFLPGRTFELIASGRPLAACTPASSQVGRLVEPVANSFCFDETSFDQAAARIKEQVDLFVAGSYRFEPLSEYARQFSSDELARKFGSLLDSIR